MSSTGSTNATSTTSSKSHLKPVGEHLDIGWQWNSFKDATKRQIICDFCGHASTGGITRAKRHQLGVRGVVRACTKIPSDVRCKLQERQEKKQAANDAIMSKFSISEDDEDVEEIYHIRAGKRPAVAIAKAKRNVKGPLDKMIFQNPEVSLKKTEALERIQTSIKDTYANEVRQQIIQYIARFFYGNGIPFNVARSKSFKLMIEAIGNFGPHLKPPSYYELRVPYSKRN